MTRVLLALASAAGATHASAGTKIKFTEINLNWFGSNGGPSGGRETRAASVRRWFQDNDLLADVMVLEEIVDIGLLQNTVLAGAYTCHSYDRASSSHQHVVICHKPAFTFDVAADDDNYELEDVDVTGNLRPAVHGILKDRSGRALVHVFGVHLKAMPDKSAVRLEQIGRVTSYIGDEADRVPNVIFGDFNTFNDDPERMDEAFDGVGMTQLALPEPYTWASATESFDPAKFDRVWMTEALAGSASGHVIGPCNGADRDTLASYNRAVSDHCAVSVTIDY